MSVLAGMGWGKLAECYFVRARALVMLNLILFQSLHAKAQEAAESVHWNYIQARNLRSQ
jgi:hypothetical protein